MKKSYLPIVVMTAFVSTALASARAQVFEGPHTKTISTISKKHLYIENKITGLDYSILSQNHTRLTMLANLMSSSNAPPDLVSALRLAIENAEINLLANAEIQIVQKELKGKERTIFDTLVEVTDFNGNASDLLHRLELPEASIELDKTFALGGSIPDSSKLDCKLSAFSFKGTLRGLLKEMAKKRDALGGYVIMVGKDLKLSVKLIP